MKVQKHFMRTRMHGTPTGRPDYYCGVGAIVLSGEYLSDHEVA